MTLLGEGCLILLRLIESKGKHFVLPENALLSMAAAKRLPKQSSYPHVAVCVDQFRAHGRGVMRGVAQYVETHGPWLLLIDPLAESGYREGRSENWRGDGILTYVQERQRAERLRRLGIPTVELFGYRDDNELPLVCHDDVAAGRMAAEHLIERNFQHLAFYGYQKALWSDQRQMGFVQSAARAGCPPPTCLSIKRQQIFVDLDRIQEELARWLTKLPKPVGLMACSDHLAQHVLDACLRAHLAVPEEVAVVGVDNDEEICRLSNPSLTSVMLNSERVGYEGAQLLDRLMHGRVKTARVAPQRIEPLGVITRRSSDVNAIPDPLVGNAMRLIRERACQGLEIGELLNALNVSRSVFYQRFHDVMHRSPHHEILRVQLERVKSLLTQTPLPLKHIAELAGFDDPNYLNVAFKREAGVTPGEYRSQHHGF